MALLFSIILGAAICILVYFIYSLNQERFIKDAERTIDADISSINQQYNDLGLQQVIQIINKRSTQSNQHFYFLMDSNSQKLAGNISQLPLETSLISQGLIKFTIEDKLLAAKIYTFPNGTRLLVAIDIKDISNFYERLQILSAIIIALMILVVAVSYLISVFVVNRTNLIAQTAQEIIQTADFSRRISVHGDWDDLSYMSQVLNSLLEQTEKSIQGIRTVSDNIAHDLRTPLTRLRNQLEAKNETQLVNEADQLLQTFSALLRISNLEIGKRHTELVPVELHQLLIDVIELYDPLIEEKQISLTTNLNPIRVRADKDILFQMLANLLDNAIKFTPNGGQITISTHNHTLTISDSGIGIPEQEKSRVFERFYRTEASRNSLGTGLGLSLVAAIAKVHHAKIDLLDNQPGLKVIITFPS